MTANQGGHSIEVLRGPEYGYAMIRHDMPAKRAIIFVHGFNGDPVSTWLRFQELVDELATDHPSFQLSDLFFYKYASFSTDIPAQSDRLLQFIRTVFPVPKPALIAHAAATHSETSDAHSSATRASRYENLALVGHSMGSVLIREVVVTLLSKYGFDQLDETRLTADERAIGSADVFLFAPSHLGFSPTGAAGFFYEFIQNTPMLNTFCKPALKSLPIHKDLESQSAFLKELRRRTELVARAFPWATALRPISAFGDDEHIVEIQRYDCDPASVIVPGQNHQSVCKPTKDYQFPLRFVNGSATTTTA